MKAVEVLPLATVVCKDSGGSVINTDSCERNGVSAIVDTLRKALQITLDEYYFGLFQACENMMFLAYTILFLTLGDVGLHGWVPPM